MGHKLDASFMRIAFGFSAFLILGFMQVVSWGSHSLEIIPLQLGEWTGVNSMASREHMAVIALDAKKYDLVEHLYGEIATSSPEQYSRLGKFQMSRAKFKDAAISFGRFFAAKQENLEARYQYARALSETGQIDDGAKQFEYVLRAKPGVRQVTVITYYVKMLMQAGRFDQARAVIDEARKNDRSAGNFMDTEYKVIVERQHSRT